MWKQIVHVLDGEDQRLHVSDDALILGENFLQVGSSVPSAEEELFKLAADFNSIYDQTVRTIPRKAWPLEHKLLYEVDDAVNLRSKCAIV